MTTEKEQQTLAYCYGALEGATRLLLHAIRFRCSSEDQIALSADVERVRNVLSANAYNFKKGREP